MHLSELLQQYGYVAVFFAGLFEGETILMLGAFAVHQGYLSLVPLIACGAAAAFLTDQFYFHLGRRKGAELLASRPKLRAHIERVNGFVSRHPVATIFLMRFAWGLRIALPATLGMGRDVGRALRGLAPLAAICLGDRREPVRPQAHGLDPRVRSAICGPTNIS